MTLCQNNKGICLFSTCCIPVGKIKMHIFSQVFITDVIFNSRADCKRVVVVVFLVCVRGVLGFVLFLFFKSVVSSSWGFGEEVRQTAVYL